MPDPRSHGDNSYAQDIDRVVVSSERIAERVAELADEIAATYRGAGQCEEVTVVAVMTGSLIFLADLIRRLPLRLKIEIASASSYPGASTTTCGPTIGILPSENLSGRHVLVVDDVLDSGKTLQAVVDQLARHCPRSLKTCVLLAKDRPDIPARRDADFVGFRVAGDFVVGYGLDFDGLYRNLDGICILKEQVLSAASHARAGEAHP
jgi:hypoxanthine phosphoribosyltransferase